MLKTKESTGSQKEMNLTEQNYRKVFKNVENLFTNDNAKKKAIKQSIINALVWLTIKPLIWLITKPLTWAVICATIAVVWGIYGETDEKDGIVNGAFYFGVAAAIIAMFSFMASENEKESNHK